MPSWPSTLPDFVLQRGFQEGFKDLAVFTQMDGARKRRKRFTNRPRPFQVTLSLSSAQLTALQSFVEEDLDGGALSFTWVDPRSQVATDFALTETPSVASAIGPFDFEVTLALEELLASLASGNGFDSGFDGGFA